MFKTILLPNIYFVETFFWILWWIERSKEQHLFEIENFYNIINVFIVTFDHMNASLLNISINFFQIFWPHLLITYRHQTVEQ